MLKKLIFIDCDSTLSSIEGIDELARLRGEEAFRACENMTNLAMDGKIAIEDIYGARLDLIKPTAQECARIGQKYIDTVEPTAVEFIVKARERGWEPIIVSGGLTQAIAPFARFLGINRVRAVDLKTGKDGSYQGFDSACPTSRMGGKQVVIRADQATFQAERVIMIGDGASDLETQPFVDLFIGFGGFLERDVVKAQAKVFVHNLIDVLDHLPED